MKKLLAYSFIILIGTALLLSEAGCGKAKKTAITYVDSIEINNNYYGLKSIGDNEFINHKYKFPQFADTTEIDSSKFRVDPDHLTFYPANADVLIFKSKENVRYQMGTCLNTLNAWFLIAHYSDWSSYFMVNQTSGKTLVVWGQPKASPNREYFACISNNIKKTDELNGLQLFHNNNGESEPLFEFTSDNWQPLEIKWKDNNHIWIKRRHPQEFSSVRVDYVELNVAAFQ